MCLVGKKIERKENKRYLFSILMRKNKSFQIRMIREEKIRDAPMVIKNCAFYKGFILFLPIFQLYQTKNRKTIILLLTFPSFLSSTPMKIHLFRPRIFLLSQFSIFSTKQNLKLHFFFPLHNAIPFTISKIIP